MTREQIRQATAQIVDALPEEATWDDLMYRVYARQRIEEGLADSAAGRIFTLNDISTHFHGAASRSEV